MSPLEKRARELFGEGLDPSQTHNILKKEGLGGSPRTVASYFTAYNAKQPSLQKYKSHLTDTNYLEELIGKDTFLDSSKLQENPLFLGLSYRNGDLSAREKLVRITEGYSIQRRLKFFAQVDIALTKKGYLDFGNVTKAGLEVLEKYSTTLEHS